MTTEEKMLESIIHKMLKQRRKSLVKFRIVLKDSNRNLYAFIQEGDGVIKVKYNGDGQIIEYSNLNKFLQNERIKKASSAESLAFNFAYNATKKGAKSNKKARIPKEIDLIGKLLKKKAKESALTLRVLFAALCVESLHYFFISESKNIGILIFICIMFLLAFAKQILLQIRVKNGLYGTCYSEAKEILAFIADYQKRNRPGSGKTTLDFPAEEPDRLTQKNLNRGGAACLWELTKKIK